MRLTGFLSFLLLMVALLVQTTAAAQERDSLPQMASPNPIPDSVLGTIDYYHWRETDFQQRSKHAGLNLESPDYYCSYGHKYAHRFSWHIRPHLSNEGKQWLDRTLLLLQIGTEACLQSRPELELQPESLNRMLFDLHPAVYAAAGFYELTFADQLRILIRLDPHDLISPEGQRQAKTLIRGYIRYKVGRIVRLRE